MPSTDPAYEFAFEKHIDAEATNALTKAGLYSAILGFLGGGIPLAVHLSGAAENLLAPALFGFFAGGFSFIVFLLARSGLMKGAVLYISFVSLPTLFFLLTHFMMPAGSATYITGPISYLYFHLIIMTGFVFKPRLSVMAGLISACGYMSMYLLDMGNLAGISACDSTLAQDLSAPSIYVVKSFMMAFGGAVVALLSMISRRLILRVLEEERHKAAISKLFGQYVSPEVKEKIISEKLGMTGERKKVVVLFSDLRGFSGFCEGLNPEEIVARLNEYFEAMVSAVTSQGGVVDKFMGDAVMAVFGGVLNLENPAESALNAAFLMRAGLRKLNAKWAAEGRKTFENGIGMHFGEVLQGSIGSEKRKEFTVIGDTVNIASRVEGLSKEFPEKILFTSGLFEVLPEGSKSLCRHLGNVSVKGKSETVSIYGAADGP